MLNDPRVVLERLCAERGEDFAGLSRMLGRNSAYIQQFVRRGVPKRLGETERRKLARYFSIPESMLGGPAEDEQVGGLVPVKRSPVRASAGPGAIPNDGVGLARLEFIINTSIGVHPMALVRYSQLTGDAPPLP